MCFAEVSERSIRRNDTTSATLWITEMIVPILLVLFYRYQKRFSRGFGTFRSFALLPRPDLNLNQL